MKLDIATLTDLITQSLPLQDWGFTESAKTDLFVIYDSQWCRVKFLIEKDRARDYLHVYYGRLHASDNSWTTNWKGEACYCWHNHLDIQLALQFLDGVSPQDSYRRYSVSVPFFQAYYDSEFAKSISNVEEQLLKLHSFMWEHYGLRLFELFDIRRPDLWQPYLDFLRELYRLIDKQMDAVYERDGLVREPLDPPEHKKC